MDTFEGELKKNWNARRILPNADWCDTKSRTSVLAISLKFFESYNGLLLLMVAQIC
ncbi:hypothetical protein F6447_13050 (plasmid) [Enterococcus faecium]|uniref:hypothetical protein n=1 Tax=Enterococcus faecium TaxID=1352 RepID=UPI00142F96C6|nr:hypothetical protein [Enterococcus faecium]QIS84835.1 hypothetical protein F6447_13050 [Enterococcus faecium]